jgi:uncharacterized protein (TIGR02246 family)
MLDTSKLTAEAAAVREVIEAYADRLRAGDAGGVVDMYAQDAAVMTPDMPAIVGREQLTAVYTSALEAVTMDFKFEFDDVAVRGEVAVARTRASGQETVRATGEEVPARYRELFVLRRQEGGWKITEYMFQPMPDSRDAGH